MANEVPNRSHAGLVFQAFVDAPPQIARGSWGIEVASLVRLTGSVGVYAVRLSLPLSLVVNADGSGAAAIDGIVLFSAVSGQKANPEVRVTLSPDLFPPPPNPAPGDRIVLPFLVISIFSTNLPVNFPMVVNIEVRRSPED